MPTGPGMAQIVPAEVLDTHPRQAFPECLDIRLSDSFTKIGKDVTFVFPRLLSNIPDLADYL